MCDVFEELCDRAEDCRPVLFRWVVPAGMRDEPSVRDQLGDFAPAFDRYGFVLAPVDHQRRGLDRR